VTLRARILLGSILWTAGLLAVAHMLSVALIIRGPFRLGVAHSGLLLIAAIACMAAGLAQARIGLSSVKQLRARLSAVRDGHARRVEGAYPGEVQPLVNDLNALLDHRERIVSRAIAKAGDLAHGLKTPLAVLSHESDRAAAAGHDELASIVAQQVERMRRQIDYHLAHARAAASGAAPGARCSVKASADGIARTLLRLHADRGVAIHVNVPAQHAMRGQREDLDEILGNLLDNACAWARSRVIVTSAADEGTLVIDVDDDGPGLPPAMWETVLQRGVRADEAAPGSGFGLAIVRDLAELYGGSIALGRAPAGGLRARLQLPAG
jgi:signal transduction histidine kinase